MRLAELLKVVAIAFLLALAVYFVAFSGIEHLRTRKGPWEVTFTHDTAGAPAIVINEPKLNISNVTIDFPHEETSATNSTLDFARPKQVPFEVPFGQCIFMDTTFQPGTVVFNFFGHEIQLIPRVLTIDKKEYPWQSGITLTVTNGARAKSGAMP
jgi:hypothetical protein